MAQTAQLRIVDRSENEAQRVFALQREAYMAHPYPSLAERKENLRKLDKILSENAQAIAEAFHRQGAAAKVSSIHVNAWFGNHDKLTMSEWFLADSFDIRVEKDLNHIAYCGDSPNDAPMYAVFPLGIGVANIRPYAKLMAHLPNYVTMGEGGHGFAEFADAVLKARDA